MSVMSTPYQQIQVCKSFQAKIQNNQLCYEVDLERFVDKKNNIERALELGFNFIMDYNEDRQIIIFENNIDKKDSTLASSIIESDNNAHAFIYLNTIGMSSKQKAKFHRKIKLPQAIVSLFILNV